MSRLAEAGLETAINEYGRTLVSPPLGAAKFEDVVSLTVGQTPAWSVWVPLWTFEEGRSDLTLELTITQNEDGFVIQIDDLRVL
jgi:hypothetical protein